MDKMSLEEAGQALDGLLLGDGNLALNGKNARFHLSRYAKGEMFDYLLGVMEALTTLGVVFSSNQPTVRIQKAGRTIGLQSRNSPILTGLFRLWGFEARPKKIPKGLRLTPLALAYWFESDGSTTWIRQGGGNSVRLTLCSYQFGKAGNLRLHGLLKNIGIEMHLGKRWDRRYDKDRWDLETAATATVNRFLDIVEPHLHPPYLYKVKRPRLRGK